MCVCVSGRVALCVCVGVPEFVRISVILFFVYVHSLFMCMNVILFTCVACILYEYLHEYVCVDVCNASVVSDHETIRSNGKCSYQQRGERCWQ